VVRETLIEVVGVSVSHYFLKLIFIPTHLKYLLHRTLSLYMYLRIFLHCYCASLVWEFMHHCHTAFIPDRTLQPLFPVFPPNCFSLFQNFFCIVLFLCISSRITLLFVRKKCFAVSFWYYHLVCYSSLKRFHIFMMTNLKERIMYFILHGCLL
jgi:hypothetical protein